MKTRFSRTCDVDLSTSIVRYGVQVDHDDGSTEHVRGEFLDAGLADRVMAAADALVASLVSVPAGQWGSAIAEKVALERSIGELEARASALAAEVAALEAAKAAAEKVAIAAPSRLLGRLSPVEG